MKTRTAILIVLAFVFAAFVVSIPIHCAYDTNSPMIVTDWSATDVLLYCGSVLGGLATLTAIIISVWHDDKKREEDIKRNDDLRKSDITRDDEQRKKDRDFYKEERENEKKHYKEQREEERDFYKKEHETERQYYKEQREEDRKIRLKTERYGIISKHLHDSLCNLDMRAFFVINEEADAYYSNRVKRIVMEYNQRAKKVCDIIAPDTIPNLIGNANRNVLLGLVLFSDEKPYFNQVIEDLKELTIGYTSLLPILEKYKDDELRFPANKENEQRFAMNDTTPMWIGSFLEESRDLCCKYEEMHTSIENAMADYEQSYNPRPIQMDDSQAAPLSTSSDAVGSDGCVDS